MSTATAALYREHYLNTSYGVKSWLLTKDHKRIALLYLMSITLFFFLGGAFAVLIRLELLTPQGDLVQAETYNRLFTMHGVIMVFFFLIPSIPAVLGNFLVPMMIGARDLAFPRLNLLSWYIYTAGGIFTLAAVVSGGVDTRLDLLYALQQHVRQLARDRDGCRHLHYRILVDSYGIEFYRHDSQDARAGPHLVPIAALRLVELRNSADYGAGHSGDCDNGPSRRN